MFEVVLKPMANITWRGRLNMSGQRHKAVLSLTLTNQQQC